MISEKSKREILEAARVEEVIGDFINLRRRGVNLIGLCPFHNEKTPSFNVNPARNIYKCFGCGKGGDPVDFLMEHEHISFVEALRWLAKKYGIALEEIEPTAEAVQAAQVEESLFLVNQFAADYYQEQLFDSDRGRSVGLGYFKDRGFREDTIRKFGLGFAPMAGDALLAAARNRGYDIPLLEQLGLVKNNRDFFRDRVMFSIHNLSGKVIAFAGRILQKDPKAPKYINSPETEIYFKSKVLYGLYFAKQAIRREDECLLVEGYTDVISLHQAGIENAVASSGTSLTVDQIRLVKRYTPNVTLLFDGDAAGLKAALRGVDLLLEQDLNVRVVVLPDGEDPDSFVQKMGLTVTREFIAANKKDFILFKAGLLLDEAGHDPVRKADLVKDIIGSMALIPDPIKRSIYAKECARLFSMDESLVVAAINQKMAVSLQKEQQKKAGAPSAGLPQSPTAVVAGQEAPVGAAEYRDIGHDFQERDLARILILFGKEWYDEREGLTIGRFVIDNIEDVIDAFDNKLYLSLAQDVQQRLQQQQPLLSPQEYVRHEHEGIRQLALDLLSMPNELSENWEKKWGIILNQVHPDANWKEDSEQMIKRFRLRKLKRVLEQNLIKIKEAEVSGDAGQIVVFLKLHHRIKAIHDELARQVKTVIG